jgi:hypothetical protein
MTTPRVRPFRSAPRRRAAGGQRREEVERRLAELGLAARGPRAWERPGGEPQVARLCALLPELGPVFGAFGNYLGSRADLLAESDCRQLAAVPDRPPPLAPEALRDLLFGELRRPPEAVFAAFEAAPCDCTQVYQEHRARLAPLASLTPVAPLTDPGGGGIPVLVRLVRPGFEEELRQEAGLLPLLAPALAAGGAARSWIGGAVADFVAASAAAADLAREARALAAVAEDGAASGLALAAPRVVAAVSTPRVLIREELPGATLADLAPPSAETAEAAEAAAAAPAGAAPAGDGATASSASPAASWRGDEAAVRLCRAWLRQAFFGQVFPVAQRDGDVRLPPAGGLAWTGGTFESLPAAAKENLWEYLQAAAAHDPPRACAALIQELEGGPPDDPLGRGLDQRLRQLVPFRDSGWSSADDLAAYLFLHWRCATELGYRPRPHLVAFYRGLAGLAAQARRLAPERDPLAAGLESTRIAAGLGDVARLFESDQVKQVLGSYAAAMLALPQRFEELLRLATEGKASIKLEMVESPAERRRKDRSAAALAALLAIAAVALLAQHLIAAGTFGPWAERVAAVALGALGALLLRGLARRP